MSTSLDIPTLRAKCVHDALLAHPSVDRVEDIPGLFPGWRPEILGEALDVLVTRGRNGGITETADGRLRVHAWNPEAAA